METKNDSRSESGRLVDHGAEPKKTSSSEESSQHKGVFMGVPLN